MARRTEKQKSRQFPENFTPAEMATIAACVVVPYQDLPMYQESKLASMKRPWPIYDRIVKAIEQIVAAFEVKSHGRGNITPFAVAEFDKGMQTVSSEVPLLPEEVKESNLIWTALMNWSSTGNDTTILKKIKEFGGDKRCEALGFTKKTLAPFELEKVEGGIDALSLDEIKERPAEIAEEAPKADPKDFSTSSSVIPKRRPGRPRRNAGIESISAE